MQQTQKVPSVSRFGHAIRSVKELMKPDPVPYFEEILGEEDFCLAHLGGFKGLIVVTDPATSWEILQDTDSFIKGILPKLKTFRIMGWQNLVMSDWPQYGPQKKAAGKFNHPTNLANQEAALHEIVNAMFDEIDSRADRTIPDLAEFAHRLTLRIGSQFFFGQDFSTELSIIADYFELGTKPRLNKDEQIRFKEVERQLDQFLYRLIEAEQAKMAARGANAAPENLLQSLVTLIDDPDTAKYFKTRKQRIKLVRDNLITFTVAMRDTTAVAIAMGTMYLAKNSKAFARLRSDCATILGGQAAHFRDLSTRMPYLDAVIEEALRLSNPAPMVLRQVKKTTTIGKYKFKKGWLVVIAQCIMHTKAKYFQQPLDFVPERHIPAESKFYAAPPHACIPFGGGGRICYAWALAKMILTKVYSTQSTRYSGMTLTANADAELYRHVTSQAPKGVAVRMEK